jgi:hypothetical protein
VELCLALGARQIAGWSAPEARLAAAAIARAPRSSVAKVRRAIQRGADPLGEQFCQLRSPARRRGRGATYTPASIIAAMTGWAASAVVPERVIDPGSGSGRFLLASGRAFHRAELVGVELDPLAALMSRAGLAASGFAARARVERGDYRRVKLPRIRGTTLFIGNPPYVRHHCIARRWKRWLTETARYRGVRASQLSGLHVYFFLATLMHARDGDLGAFVTASEWLDVNYGQLLRELLCGPLGLQRLEIIDPRAVPFSDAQTTAVITCFRVGVRSASVAVRRSATTGQLKLCGGRRLAARDLATSRRWSNLTQRAPANGSGMVELGELCRVHRGQVTGCNRVWVCGEETPPLPSSCLVPAITRARELIEARGTLRSAAGLRRIIELPLDLDELCAAERRQVDRFLRWARDLRANQSYISRHRSPWWRVQLRAPAPILATYMARRPPTFVRNLAAVRHINIAHGLYPREQLADACLDRLALWLSTSASRSFGRTYAGGLTKFEPKEMERLLVPLDRVEL